MAVAPTKQDLFNTSKGDGVVPPYRIPGIATTKSGRLIAVASRLVCGTDPGYGQVDVVCRISDNNGETWSEMKDVAVGDGKTSATVNYFETAFGDPAIVADRTSNEVMVLAVAGCTVYGNGNTTRQNPNLIALIRSKDNGDTWEKPINVTEQIYSLFDDGNPIQAAFVAGGKVFQSRIVKKGDYYRVYAAMCARPNGNRVIYSDDFGATWHALGGASALPAQGGDEPKCEELPDGRVILSSRVGGGRIYNIYTYPYTLPHIYLLPYIDRCRLLFYISVSAYPFSCCLLSFSSHVLYHFLFFPLPLLHLLYPSYSYLDFLLLFIFEMCFLFSCRFIIYPPDTFLTCFSPILILLTDILFYS